MMRRFDLRAAELVKEMDEQTRNTVYRIAVEGLAERRPSLLCNDRIVAWIPDTCDEEYVSSTPVVDCGSCFYR